MAFFLFMLICVYVGSRIGAYAMACHLFSLIVSVYVSVMTTPLLLQVSPVFLPAYYSVIVCLAAVFLVVFVGLEIFFRRFFWKYKQNYFGVFLDNASSAAAGFLFGHVLWGFLLLVYCILPFSRTQTANQYLNRNDAKAFACITVSRVCDFTASVSLDYPDVSPKEIARALTELQEK